MLGGRRGHLGVRPAVAHAEVTGGEQPGMLLFSTEVVTAVRTRRGGELQTERGMSWWYFSADPNQVC